MPRRTSFQLRNSATYGSGGLPDQNGPNPTVQEESAQENLQSISSSQSVQNTSVGQAITSFSKINPVKYPEFKGEPTEEVERFLVHFDMVASSDNVQGVQYANLLGSKLGGVALAWFYHQPSDVTTNGEVLK
jgi:hypothetical protein